MKTQAFPINYFPRVFPKNYFQRIIEKPKDKKKVADKGGGAYVGYYQVMYPDYYSPDILNSLKISEIPFNIHLGKTINLIDIDTQQVFETDEEIMEIVAMIFNLLFPK